MIRYWAKQQKILKIITLYTSPLSAIGSQNKFTFDQVVSASQPIVIVVIFFQVTTIAYIIGMREFLHSTSLVAERTIRPIELYLFAALVYLIICFTGTRIATLLEKKE